MWSERALEGDASASTALFDDAPGGDHDPATAAGGTLYRPRWIAAGAPVVARIEPQLRKEADLAKLWDVSGQEIGAPFDAAVLVASPS